MSDSAQVSDIERSSQDRTAKYPKWVKAFRALFVWYPKNLDAAERKPLFKLDLAILVYAALSFFCKYLDQTNITNAYVSGMKEALSLYGDELNFLNITYLSGYCVGQIPFLLLISRPQVSRYVLPTLEVLYGVCTFTQASITNVQQLYAVRFLVGFFEAPSFAGVHFVLGKFYGAKSFRGNPPELYVRAAVFFMCSPIGSMFSGYLQSAAYKNLNGVGGKAGWQWLFIIDGIITVPIAFIGFLFWPPLPEHSKPWYLNANDYQILLKRAKRYAVAETGKLNFDVWRRTFKQWKVYVFVVLYTAMLLAFYPTGYFALWLRTQGTYTIPQVNNYPTGVSAVSIVGALVASALASAYEPWFVFMLWVFAMLVFTIIMTIYNVTPGLVFFAFYMSGVGSGGPVILFSSINRILSRDQESRALVLGITMGVAYLVYTFAPLGLFPTDVKKHGLNAAPRWKTGFPTSMGLSILVFFLALTAYYYEKRDIRLNGDNTEDQSYEDEENDSIDNSAESETKESNNVIEVQKVQSQ